MPTTEEKYQWLLSQMAVKYVDYWEWDALIQFKDAKIDESGIYFQYKATPAYLPAEEVYDIDKAIELAMNDWYRNKHDKC